MKLLSRRADQEKRCRTMARMINRRNLMKSGICLTSGLAGAGNGFPTVVHGAPKAQSFNLNYAPHFGTFRHAGGEDLIGQLEFAAEQGFTAWEDNGMRERSVADQKKLGRAMDRLGMQMGVFVATKEFKKVTFAGRDQDVWDHVLADLRDSVAVSRRVNAKWMTVVPGHYDKGVEWDYQTANCIELLKRCCDIFEPEGMVMVLEPLNWWRNHEGLFLHKSPQAYQICRAVDSPACKILFDIYHQQISEGNLIPNIDRAWSEIAYFQIGDNPGRREPGTGEINYRNIFRHIHRKGFAGIMGMEHGNSQAGTAGDHAVIDAYRRADRF